MIEITTKIRKWGPPETQNVRGKPTLRGVLSTDAGLDAKVFVELGDDVDRLKKYDRLRDAVSTVVVFIGDWEVKDFAFVVPIEGGWRVA